MVSHSAFDLAIWSESWTAVRWSVGVESGRERLLATCLGRVEGTGSENGRELGREMASGQDTRVQTMNGKHYRKFYRNTLVGCFEDAESTCSICCGRG